MSEPDRKIVRMPEEHITPRPDREIRVKQRVRDRDYGAGEIVADLGPIGVQVLWDEPKGAVGPQLMLHDRVFVERLERI